MDDRARLAGLAAFADELGAASFDAGRWHPSEPMAEDPDVITMPWYELSDRALAFVGAIGASEWIVPFDWMAWAQTDEGRSLRDDRAVLESASVDQLQRLLTTLVRADRFSEGTLGWAFESGLMAAIARRARVLEASMR